MGGDCILAGMTKFFPPLVFLSSKVTRVKNDFL
jgi:hypothetical protein